MAETYVSVAIICGASLLVGRAILALSGRDTWSWLEPAVGFAALITGRGPGGRFAALITVAGIGARLPGAGTAATLLVILLGLASLAALALRYGGYREALMRGLPVAILVLLALSLPFAVSGRWGLIGVGFNNDLGLHLA